MAYKGRAGWAREGTGRSGREGVGTEAKEGTGGFLVSPGPGGEQRTHERAHWCRDVDLVQLWVGRQGRAGGDRVRTCEGQSSPRVGVNSAGGTRAGWQEHEVVDRGGAVLKAPGS